MTRAAFTASAFFTGASWRRRSASSTNGISTGRSE